MDWREIHLSISLLYLIHRCSRMGLVKRLRVVVDISCTFIGIDSPKGPWWAFPPVASCQLSLWVGTSRQLVERGTIRDPTTTIRSARYPNSRLYLSLLFLFIGWQKITA